MDEDEQIMGITLQQPWASLFAHGYRQWFTRSISFPKLNSPTVFICAAAEHDQSAWDAALEVPYYVQALEEIEVSEPEHLPYSAVLARAQVVHIEKTEMLTGQLTFADNGEIGFLINRAERAGFDWVDDRYGYKLAQVRPLPEPVPIEYRPSSDVWVAPAPVLVAVRRVIWESIKAGKNP